MKHRSGFIAAASIPMRAPLLAMTRSAWPRHMPAALLSAPAPSASMRMRGATRWEPRCAVRAGTCDQQAQQGSAGSAGRRRGCALIPQPCHSCAPPTTCLPPAPPPTPRPHAVRRVRLSAEPHRAHQPQVQAHRCALRTARAARTACAAPLCSPGPAPNPLARLELACGGGARCPACQGSVPRRTPGLLAPIAANHHTRHRHLLKRRPQLRPSAAPAGSTPVVRQTKHIFLDLPKLSADLQAYIDRTSTLGGWSSNCVQVWGEGVGSPAGRGGVHWGGVGRAGWGRVGWAVPGAPTPDAAGADGATCPAGLRLEPPCPWPLPPTRCR